MLYRIPHDSKSTRPVKNYMAIWIAQLPKPVLVTFVSQNWPWSSLWTLKLDEGQRFMVSWNPLWFNVVHGLFIWCLGRSKLQSLLKNLFNFDVKSPAMVNHLWFSTVLPWTHRLSGGKPCVGGCRWCSCGWPRYIKENHGQCHSPRPWFHDVPCLTMVHEAMMLD